MSRKLKIPLYTLAGLSAMVVLLVLAAVIVAQTAWFRDKVRQRIIAEAENATGGRVHIGGFDLDWSTLTATVRDFTIHGTEESGQAPLFRADSVRLGLKVASVWKRRIDIAELAVNRPRVNLIVYPDGRTNMPKPKAASRAGKSTVETVLDLAIRRFQIADGTVRVAARSLPLNVLGENLRAQVFYEAGPPRYRGEVSFRQLNVTPGSRPVLPFDLDAKLVLTGNRLEIVTARFGLGDSSLDLTGALSNFASPRTELQYVARVHLKDVGDDLRVSQIASVGVVTVTGKATITGAGSSFVVGGKAVGSGLGFEERGIHIRNIGLATAVTVTPDRIDLTGLEISALRGRFSGRAEMAAWRRFQVQGQIRNYSLEELTRIHGVRSVAWNGVVSGPVGVIGELRKGNLRDVEVRTRLTVAPVKGDNPVEGLINAAYNQNASSIDFGQSYLATRYSRMQFAGTLGQRVDVALQSTNLNDSQPAIGMFTDGPPPELPVTLLNKGVARFQGTVTGPIADPSIQGRGSLAQFLYEGHAIERAEASVVVSSSGVRVQDASLVKGQMRVAGTLDVGFEDWGSEAGNPISGALTLRAASLTALLAEFGEKLPLTGGAVVANGKVAGTLAAPRASGEVQVAKLVAWGQPLDSVRGQVRYAEDLLEVIAGQIQVGPSRADVSGSFEHPQGNWQEGRLRLQVATGGIRFAQLQALAERVPELQGRLETQMAGELTLARSGLRPGVFNGWVALKDLGTERDRLGSLLLTASGTGKTLSAKLEGELAGSKVSGECQWTPEGDYPAHGHVEFTALKFSQVLAHLGKTPGQELPFEGFVAGKANFSGLSSDPQSWKATVELPAFEVRPPANAVERANSQELVLRNAGPILLDVDARGVRVRQAVLRGKDTDLTVSGAAGFGGKNPWDLRVRGGVNLALLQDLDKRIVSSAGAVALDVSVRGALARPDVYGRIDLKNAALNIEGLPNGIDNANGLIFLYRDRAAVDNLTLESGGGKISVGGFVGFAGVTNFHLQAKATDVRVRYPEGVSSSVDANLSFTGTMDRSLLGGEVIVTRMGFNPRSDLGSILARSAQPARAPAGGSRFEQGLHFDVHLATSPQVRLETKLTRDIQADADLRLRGDLIRPVLLGRVLVNQGEVLFFGSQYSISSGQILFVNGSKIEPVVNIDLETRARGVEITLHVSGPVEKMNVSYRSDPPLSFPEIVGLLTTGREPASTMGTTGSQSPLTQSWGQAGASALLTQAIANPLAGRLQRFFGVSRLKIDPQITGATTNTAAARVTVEQQISSNLLFTYITDLSRAQAQTIRVDWDLMKGWSAVALREENGLFGIDFLYKKQFK